MQLRRLLPVGLLVILAGGVYAAASYWRARPLREYPPTTPLAATAAAAHEFAGADACAQCHGAQHAAWSASTHGRAGATPHETSPIRAFDGSPIVFADARVLPQRQPDGALAFIVQRRGRPDAAFAVVAMVGGAHMAGGGTQAYFTRHVDGTVRMLPWEQSAENGWFCNTDTRADHAWQPITQRMRLADCGDWPPRRTLGQHPRLASCQQCHGSGINLTRSQDGSVAVSWRSLAIDCESCHGPARAHAESAQRGTGEQHLPVNPAKLTREASVQLCLQCHALKDPLQPGYASDGTSAQHYSVGLPAVSGEALLPDGRTRTFAYQEGHLSSACYLDGGMTCVDCHSPHDQSYRSYQRAPLAGRLDDGQCLGCHLSKATSVQQHTRHQPDSPGSRCVACHMAYLQQPAVGNAVRYARADHTISIPRPALDSVLGVRGACAACHAERSDTDLARTIDGWFEERRPLSPAIAALLAPAESVELSTLLENAARQPRATLALLGRELQRRVASGDTSAFDERTRAALLDVANAPDVDLAAAAFALLHFVEGGERRTRNALVDVMTSHATREPLRVRAVTLLGWAADSMRAAGNALAAIHTYEKALQLQPVGSDVRRNLGYALLQLGDFNAALDAFRAATAQSPNDALAHIGAGLALVSGGQEHAAAEAYRAALRADPYEPLAHLNLGNVALRSGQHVEAVRFYERAIELDGGLAAAHFNLARARIALNDLPAAAVALRDGLDFEPGNAAAAEMLAQLEMVSAADQRR